MKKDTFFLEKDQKKLSSYTTIGSLKCSKFLKSKLLMCYALYHQWVLFLINKNSFKRKIHYVSHIS